MILDGFISDAAQKKTVWTSGEANIWGSETINDLLLSADELSIAEKNSFIQLYLKPGKEVEGITNLLETKENVYRKIFQRKVNKLKRINNNEDFSIKPIPK
ncbi:MAG TPA: hypothetical protein PKI55_03500 [Chitinophagaceae bacterium]|nr:hypothetical protein [Chitinophagaceae bacterium]